MTVVGQTTACGQNAVNLNPQLSIVNALDSLIKAKLPQGGMVGVSVFDLNDNQSLYAYQADKLCRPASTQKLITAITALNQPRAQELFRTEVWA